MPLFHWLEQRCKTVIYSENLHLESVKKLNPKIIVSYNYNYIIKKDVIDYMRGQIVNLHISMLPWNRGSSPNIWSFVEDTPKGVTIHKITPGLDMGDILYQKELFFDAQKETFETSYEKLNRAIVELFKEHWEEIQENAAHSIPQQGAGSYHTMKDLEKLQERCPFDWSENVADFMKRYRSLE